MNATIGLNAIREDAYAGDMQALISCLPRGGRSAAELSWPVSKNALESFVGTQHMWRFSKLAI